MGCWTQLPESCSHDMILGFMAVSRGVAWCNRVTEEKPRPNITFMLSTGQYLSKSRASQLVTRRRSETFSGHRVLVCAGFGRTVPIPPLCTVMRELAKM